MSRSADPFGTPDDEEPLHFLLRADVLARRARPSYRTVGIAEVRRNFRETQTNGFTGPEIASVEDQLLPTEAGPLPVRIYRPGQTEKPPLIVYFHGGEFAIGDLDTHDRNARGVAAATGATVMSVAYRLAPEHPFPAAVADALNAVRAGAARATDLRVEIDRLYMAGDSAGATLALVAALAFRQGHGPQIAGVIAAYPAVDFLVIGETGSYRAFGGGAYGLSTEDIEWFRELYVPNPLDRSDWRCSPALAADVRGLPPTVIVAANYDVLRDEAAAFAARLSAGGVPVAFRIVPGTNHGFLGTPTPPPQVAETLAFIGSWFTAIQ